MVAGQIDDNDQNLNEDVSNNSQDNIIGDDAKPGFGANMKKMLTPYVQGINKAPSFNPNCNFESHV